MLRCFDGISATGSKTVIGGSFFRIQYWQGVRSHWRQISHGRIRCSVPLLPTGVIFAHLAEFAVAIFLFPTSTAWYAAIGALLLLGRFIIGIAYNMARGRHPDCHCSVNSIQNRQDGRPSFETRFWALSRCSSCCMELIVGRLVMETQERALWIGSEI